MKKETKVAVLKGVQNCAWFCLGFCLVKILFALGVL